MKLHSEGWNVKSIAGYLNTSRPTVYRTLKRWMADYHFARAENWEELVAASECSDVFAFEFEAR